MEYNLVISDMDGTLLRDDKTVSGRTVEAIRRFEAAGGRFTVATGRGVQAATQHIRNLPLRTPLVLLNGCLLYDPVTGEDILCQHLKQEALDGIWPILTADGLEMVVHNPRRAATLRMNAVVERHLRHDGITVDVRPDMGPRNAGSVVKILTIGEPERLDWVEGVVREAGIPVQLVRSSPIYLEVLPPEGGKGSALAALLAHLKLPRSRSLAVGDYLNDLDLLEAAGLGIAMENAHPALKRAAARWTASNEDDGVAQVLEDLVAGRPVGVAPGKAAV